MGCPLLIVFHILILYKGLQIDYSYTHTMRWQINIHLISNMAYHIHGETR